MNLSHWPAVSPCWEVGGLFLFACLKWLSGPERGFRLPNFPVSRARGARKRGLKGVLVSPTDRYAKAPWGLF